MTMTPIDRSPQRRRPSATAGRARASSGWDLHPRRAHEQLRGARVHLNFARKPAAPHDVAMIARVCSDRVVMHVVLELGSAIDLIAEVPDILRSAVRYASQLPDPFPRATRGRPDRPQPTATQTAPRDATWAPTKTPTKPRNDPSSAANRRARCETSTRASWPSPTKAPSTP